MFRSSAFLLLTAFTRLALALNQGDLAISLKAVESSVKTVEDVVITAVVSNPTKQDIRVLAVNNVLDTTATQSFVINSSDGKEVPFAGAHATFDFSHESLYVSIPAGQSVALNHTIASTYDFSSFAPGTSFSIASRTSTFQSAPNDAQIVVDTSAVDVQVTDELSFKPAFNAVPVASLSTPTCSDGGKQQIITDSLTYARSLAGGAASDIRNNPNGPRWNTNFGGNNPDDIWFNLDRIAGDQVGNRGIFCQQDHQDAINFCTGNPGVIAYTVVGGSETPIFVCELFFQAGTTPSICDTHTYDSTMSSRGGIILHELSHAVDGTDDVIYGCTASSQLSPADKKRNADNYRCFGLNVYLEWNCVNGPR